MFWLITFAVLIFLITYLLTVPIFVQIDSRSHLYSLRLPGLLNINVESDEKEIIKVKVVVLFVKFYVYPFNYMQKSKRPKEGKQPKKKPDTLRRIKRVLDIIKTFKVKRCYVNMDTGNVLLNARLYPLFGLLNYKGGNFHVNFNGQNQYILLMKSRPINIARTFINP